MYTIILIGLLTIKAECRFVICTDTTPTSQFITNEIVKRGYNPLKYFYVILESIPQVD